MGQVAECIIIVSKFIVLVDSDALPHTGLAVYSLDRDYDPVSTLMCTPFVSLLGLSNTFWANASL